MDGGREEEKGEPVIGTPCSGECFISLTILLVGYLLSPSWQLGAGARGSGWVLEITPGIVCLLFHCCS